MKSLGARFLLPFGLLAILLSVFVLYRTYVVSSQHANELIGQQVALALEFDLAIRDYAAEKIRPAMENFLGKDDFNPETMSTSYISRSIFENVRKKFPDYIIRFSSENPRNPSNIASGDELKMIDYFRKNPLIDKRTEEVEIGGRKYLAHFSPKRMKRECLRCHGDPADAPLEMLKRYGTKGSFHRKLGDVAGLDTIAVPIEKINAGLAREMRRQSLIFLTGLALLFGLIMAVFHFLVVRRLSAMSSHFQEISSFSESQGMTPVRVTGNDEISVLGSAFNHLIEHLRAFHASLEERVMQRTAELRQTNESLRESEARLSKAQEIAHLGSWELDLSTNHLIWSDEVYRIFGLRAQEFAPTYEAFIEAIHPDDRAAVDTVYSNSLREGRDSYEIQHRVIRKDTGEIRFVCERCEHVRDAFGVVFRSVGMVQDITERQRAEEEKIRLEERLRRAEKMEALGQLAGGVAHDLNNVLGILSGYSELLLQEIPEGQRSRGHVEKILQSTEKGAAIIQDLLTLARRGVTGSDVIDLNSVVSGFLKTPVFEKMRDYHPRVTFRTKCDENLLNIKGSALHLEKTLMNLVSNAAESIPGAGEVMIRTESRYLDTPLRGYDEVREGDYAVLTVSDTGIGIPVENRERIFEPFYTKKTMGRSGTGLGLAIVWGTVKDHNGYIDVRTEVGEGTTFTLYFPATREELIAQQQKTPVERYMGNGESVLVVDDIAEQRDIAAQLLTRLGYQVHRVPGGEEAVEFLKGNSADILVLDMIMAPGIDGLETYRRVMEVKPRQKTIIVSGFSETERVKAAQKLGAGAYVRKPYTMEKIGMAIRDELNR